MLFPITYRRKSKLQVITDWRTVHSETYARPTLGTPTTATAPTVTAQQLRQRQQGGSFRLSDMGGAGG